MPSTDGPLPPVDPLMVDEWPGNAQHLGSENQQLVVNADDGTMIAPAQLSPELEPSFFPNIPNDADTPQSVTLAHAVAEVERRMIAEALVRNAGNISRAARELGLTRRGLYLKLERHQLGGQLEKPDIQ